MEPLSSSVIALAVSGIYVVWQRYTSSRVRQVRTMQERVTYMLWTMASQIN
jgi:hypothetical protein